jgi:16S rRNA (uracil1498-N3)-methyltransferase
MAQRRWIADNFTEGAAELTGAQARHMARVLRATPGTRAHIVAGAKVWSAVVTDVSEERVVFALEEELPADQALPLTLLLAVFKFDRMEWSIEKATELGVARIVPVIARRTEKHLAHAAEARVERWRRIAHEAAKQSRRADVPAIDAPLSLKDTVAQSWPGAKILLAENERTVMLRDALLSADAEVPYTLAIGPEGGWVADEEQMFAAAGWQSVSLGPRILRAETAAIAAVSVVASALL